MQMRSSAVVLGTVVAWLATGCGPNQASIEAGSRSEALRAAAEEFDVPRALLAAHAWQLGRMEAAPPHVEATVEGGHGLEARVGWMHLTASQVERAAEVLGVDASRIEMDLVTNTRAAAALLRQEAGTAAVNDWTPWLDASAKLAGVTESELRHPYDRDLIVTMGEGLSVTFDDGEQLTLQPEETLPALDDDALGTLDHSLTAPGDYPPMRWQAAHRNNYVAGRNGGTVKYVIVHMTEGSYYSTLSWFSQANPYQSSTQYVIKSSNGEITQMVNEANGAWHAGNNHYSMNSIGIEHEGFTSNLRAWFTDAMYRSSSQLVCAIAKRHGIPVDSQHIIGHFQVPNGKRISASSPPATAAQWAANRWNYGGASNHFDPSYGTDAWNWSHYLSLVRKCVEGSTGEPQTPTPSSPNEGAITCSGAACWPSGPLARGDTGDRVYSLQTALVYLGHLDGAVALSGVGTYGPATEAAVATFQRWRGYAATGKFDTTTASALGAALKANPPPVPAQVLSYGSTGTAVSQLQERLNQVGAGLPVTGYYGELTTNAVKQFQLSHSVPNGDGSYGALTRMALAAHFANGF